MGRHDSDDSTLGSDDSEGSHKSKKSKDSKKSKSSKTSKSGSKKSSKTSKSGSKKSKSSKSGKTKSCAHKINGKDGVRVCGKNAKNYHDGKWFCGTAANGHYKSALGKRVVIPKGERSQKDHDSSGIASLIKKRVKLIQQEQLFLKPVPDHPKKRYDEKSGLMFSGGPGDYQVVGMYIDGKQRSLSPEGMSFVTLYNLELSPYAKLVKSKKKKQKEASSSSESSGSASPNPKGRKKEHSRDLKTKREGQAYEAFSTSSESDSSSD